MKSVETRIDFPDYTADNQERDAQKHEYLQETDVYIVKVKGEYGVYIPRKSLPFCLNSDEGDNLSTFWAKTKKFFTEEMKIKPRYHCIINKGIEDYVYKQALLQKVLRGM